MKVKCPGCGKTVEYRVDNAARPFCSERCKILDLGAWVDESYRVPVCEQDLSSVNENPNEHGPSEHLPFKDHLN